jgi:alpha-tubulin suppressor-like RCC1 family protein
MWPTLEMGGNVGCGIRTDASLWCWGYGPDGELGNHFLGFQYSPKVVGRGIEWSGLTAGGTHNCALHPDHSLWCWGSNFSGALGDGTLDQRSTPRRVHRPQVP